MSSPIFPVQSISGRKSRQRASSFSGPKFELALRPSYSLGPFKLGHSLWHTIDYLRSHQSLFPQFNLTYDDTSPRLSPIVISIQPNLHLVFHGTTQRLIMITLEDLDKPDSDSSDEPSHRPVTLIYNGRIIHSKGTSNSSPVTLNRSSLHQILGPTYPGWTETKEPKAALKGTPTRKLQGKAEEREFILGYPGVAFAFTLAKKEGAPKDAEIDKFQPVSTIHVFCGSDPKQPQDVLVAPSAMTHAQEPSRTGARLKGTPPPTSTAEYLYQSTERDRAVLDTEAINVRAPTLLDASIMPGWGVSLQFAKASSSRTTSPLPGTTDSSPTPCPVLNVDLILGHTTPQDAMCDLGNPQRIFYKEDDRMRIHGNGHSNHAGGRGKQDRASETSSISDEHHASSAQASGSRDGDSAFFYNYFDLGIDLLFSRDASVMSSVGEIHSAVAFGQPRLEKIVCHTNVAGDALFQRYNRCPWRVLASRASNTSAALKASSKSGEDTKPEFTFQDEFDNISTKHDDNLSMELDRGTCAEFRTASGSRPSSMYGSGEGEERSGVQLDLSTKLVGRDGLVLEVGRSGSIVGVVVF